MKNPLYKIEISHKTFADGFFNVEIRRSDVTKRYSFKSLSAATEFIAGYLIQNGRGV